jgi:large subunit ribosomal protein L24
MSKKNIQTPPQRQKMHVKKGDVVQVIAGSDKGKVGEILRALPQESTVVVKGVNIRTKHTKPQQEGESGQIVTYEAQFQSDALFREEKNRQSGGLYLYRRRSESADTEENWRNYRLVSHQF